VDASQEGNADALEALLLVDGAKAILDTEALARGGTTPATALRYAGFHGHARCVRALLGAGALPCLINANEQDALALAELGRTHPGAKGRPAEREPTVALLEAAAASDAWEVHGCGGKAEFNGCIVRIVGLLDEEKALVHDGVASACYRLKRAKLRRKLVMCGEAGVLVGLSNGPLNLCRVLVTGALSESGRYTVRLEEERDAYRRGTEIKVRRDNLAPGGDRR
jgi:hypothetical protein